MSRSRRQRDAIAPSLFPFLAVLLCTMGSLVLILMLIVAGAQASTRKVQRAVEEELEFRTAAVELKESSLEKELEEGQIDVEKKRLALQHVENHIQETLDELEELKKTAQLLEEENQGDSLEEQQRILTELEKQLAEAKQQLENAPDKPTGDKPIFAIIPYDGRNGTHRRPIYLECVDEKLIIQPEGVELVERDLQPPYGPGNPLDAALRTIRSEYAPANGAVTSTAYPLLIVRPSGILAYLRARRAMSGWDDQFGYELVDEELELAFPESKPGLERRIASALDLARQRQAAIAMAMPRTYRGAPGNYVGDDYGGGSRRVEPDSYGSSRRGNGSSRGGFSNDGFSGDGFSGDLASHEPYGASGEAVEEILSGAAGFGEGRSGGGPGRASPAGVQAGPSFGAADFGRNDPAVGSTPGMFSSTPGMYSSTQGSGEFLSGTGGQLGADGIGPEGSTANSGAGEYSSSGGAVGGSTMGASTSGSPGGGASGSMGAPDSGGEQVGIPTFGLGANLSGQSSQGDSNQAAQSGSSRRGASGAGNQSSSRSGNSQGGPGGSSRSGSASSAGGGSSETKSVAATRGRDWAWSGGSTTLTPVSRSISMQCTLEGWVLPPAHSGGKPDVIAYEGTPVERAEKLASIIRSRVDGWGFALEGGYWRPELVVEVTPGAKWRYDQLVRLFEGSGLRIRGQYAQPTGQVTLPRRAR